MITEQLSNQIQRKSSPLVTVAMPIYNAGKYLRLAVLSIVSQTFTDWELLIIDDGSTDNALNTIADINDKRIRILKDGENIGLAARLNEAIDLAQGQYLARMDGDDASYPERLMRQIEVLQNDSKLDLVAVRLLTIDENNKPTGLLPSALTHNEICAKPWRGFYLPHPTWMGKIEWFRKYRYAIPASYFCEDQELLTRSYCESKFFTIDEILFAYRIRANVDQRKLAKTRCAVLGVQLRHFSSSHQWHFLFFATVAFFGKLTSDLLKRTVRVSFYRHGILDDTSASQCNKILSDILTGSKIP